MSPAHVRVALLRERNLSTVAGRRLLVAGGHRRVVPSIGNVGWLVLVNFHRIPASGLIHQGERAADPVLIVSAPTALARAAAAVLPACQAVLVPAGRTAPFGHLEEILRPIREAGGRAHRREASEEMLMSLLDNLRFAIQRRRGPGANAARCGHLDQIRDVTRGSAGCEQCLALGDSWVHLRMCMTCGQVGCCDSSKNKHAHRHADELGHPIVRSVEPGEDWMWCFVDSTMVQAARS